MNKQILWSIVFCFLPGGSAEAGEILVVGGEGANCMEDPQFGSVHPLTGPIHIEGAEAGDILAVTLLDIPLAALLRHHRLSAEGEGRGPSAYALPRRSQGCRPGQHLERHIAGRAQRAAGYLRGEMRTAGPSGLYLA